LQTTKTWQLNLGGGLSNSQKIINIAARNPVEHVHSQGRVLADRSVLYKYLNPNLVAVTTHGPDAIHKCKPFDIFLKKNIFHQTIVSDILNVHLIDVVSGSIVFSMTHQRVRGPFSIVHSENWLVYAYFNDKVRRTEISE
jgi:ER membrane protein complex subunit 1